jgi:hypothetical protein
MTGTAQNPDTLGLALVAAARQDGGIATVGFVDACMNAEIRFRGRSESPLSFAPDWLLLPDEGTKQAFVALGFPDARILMCGNPHHDEVGNVRRRLATRPPGSLREELLPDATREQKVVVVATERDARVGRNRDARHPAPPPRHGSHAAIRRMEIVLDAFLEAIQTVNPSPYLVLRLHPKDEAHEYEAYLGRFNRIDRGGSPLELIGCADLVVGATSMLLVEATLMGVSTLALLPSGEERAWLPATFGGVCHVVSNSGELAPLVAGLLAEQERPTFLSSSDDISSESCQCVSTFIDGLTSFREP